MFHQDVLSGKSSDFYGLHQVSRLKNNNNKKLGIPFVPISFNMLLTCNVAPDCYSQHNYLSCPHIRSSKPKFPTKYRA